MKKEIIKTVCDCCDSVLTKRTAYLNDGSYQQDYVSFKDIDLCFQCAGMIFERDIVKSLKEESLKDSIFRLKKATSPNPIGPDIDFSSFLTPFKTKS